MIVTHKAFNDIADARDWYESRATGLGKRFLAAVNSTMHRIDLNPLAYPLAIEPARRANLTRFPYGVWYVAEPEPIVIAVLHHRRNPAIITDALKP